MIAHAPLPTVPVLPTHDGVRAGPCPLRGITDYITKYIDADDWGEAYIFAVKILKAHDPRKGGFAHYFRTRWKFHQIDRKREAGGRRPRPGDGERCKNNQNRRYCLSRPFSVVSRNRRAPVSEYHRQMETRDVVEAVSRRAAQTTRQRLIVRMLANGLTLSDAARATGYTQGMMSLVWNKEGLAQRVKEVIEDVAA